MMNDSGGDRSWERLVRACVTQDVREILASAHPYDPMDWEVVLRLAQADRELWSLASEEFLDWQSSWPNLVSLVVSAGRRHGDTEKLLEARDPHIVAAYLYSCLRDSDVISAQAALQRVRRHADQLPGVDVLPAAAMDKVSGDGDLWAEVTEHIGVGLSDLVVGLARSHIANEAVLRQFDALLASQLHRWPSAVTALGLHPSLSSHPLLASQDPIPPSECPVWLLEIEATADGERADFPGLSAGDPLAIQVWSTTADPIHLASLARAFFPSGPPVSEQQIRILRECVANLRVGKEDLLLLVGHAVRSHYRPGGRDGSRAIVDYSGLGLLASPATTELSAELNAAFASLLEQAALKDLATPWLVVR